MGDEIDSERVYCTNAAIKRVGGAVAVCLSDATLPGNSSNKHMTILYRRHNQWTEDEIASIDKETKAWIKAKYGSNGAPVTFNIEKWGNKSVKIKGDLNNLCIDLRKRFGAMSNDKQRVPHCELFKNSKQQKDKKYHHYKTPSNEWSSNEVSENGIVDKLQRTINKTKELKLKKERELKLLNEKENDLMHLLNEYNAKNIDDKALRLKIKQIAKSFNSQRKEMRKLNKLKQKKGRKKEKKMKRRQKKNAKKRKNKKENDVIVDNDDEKKEETNDEFVKINAETFEDSEDESLTIYSEGDENESNDFIEPGTDIYDEFDCLFEGF